MKKIATLVLLAFAIAVTARAEEDGALSLSPAVVMLRGDHGQSTTQTLTLTNGTSRAFEFDLIANDVITRDGKRTFVEAGSIAGSIAATAVFSPAHVRVLPGQSVNATVTVTLPVDSSQRAVVALFRGTNVVLSGQVPMRASLGSLLTFRSSDDVEMSAAPLVVRPQSASTNLSVSHVCANAGHEPFVAKGVLAVVDEKGALVGKSNLESRRLLPGESDQLGGEYADELEPGRYRVVVTYDYEGRTLTRSAEVQVR